MVFLFSVLFLAGAQTVGIIIYLDGGTMVNGLDRSIEQFLSAAMGKLFDAGFIATNELPMQGTEAMYFSFAPGKEQLYGAMDYSIIVLLQFNDTSTYPKSRYKLIEIKNAKILAEGNKSIADPGSSDRIQIDRAFYQAGSSIITELKGFIKSSY